MGREERRQGSRAGRRADQRGRKQEGRKQRGRARRTGGKRDSVGGSQEAGKR